MKKSIKNDNFKSGLDQRQAPNVKQTSNPNDQNLKRIWMIGQMVEWKIQLTKN
jgi:hypothetical protein